jgi:predicted dehydrogenase
MFRFGIIGLGSIARKWTQDVQQHLPSAQIAAVASRSAANASAFADEFGIARHYSSATDMLDAGGLDAIYIANPHPDHYASAMLCLERGIPVICEKPMAMHHWQVAALIAKAREKRVFLMEALWTCEIPAFRFAMEQVQKGSIGTVHTITADFGFRADGMTKPRIWAKELGAGALLDIGIYPVLLSQCVFGNPTQIKASATFTDQGVDDSCAMIFEWPNDRRAILHCSIKATTPTEAWIHGTTGSIHLHSRFHHPYALTIWRCAEAEQIELPYQGHGYHFEARSAMQSIQQGDLEHPIMTHQLSLDLAATLGRVMEVTGIEYA